MNRDFKKNIWKAENAILLCESLIIHVPNAQQALMVYERYLSPPETGPMTFSMVLPPEAIKKFKRTAFLIAEALKNEIGEKEFNENVLTHNNRSLSLDNIDEIVSGFLDIFDNPSREHSSNPPSPVISLNFKGFKS